MSLTDSYSNDSYLLGNANRYVFGNALIRLCDASFYYHFLWLSSFLSDATLCSSYTSTRLLRTEPGTTVKKNLFLTLCFWNRISSQKWERDSSACSKSFCVPRIYYTIKNFLRIQTNFCLNFQIGMSERNFRQSVLIIRVTFLKIQTAYLQKSCRQFVWTHTAQNISITLQQCYNLTSCNAIL